MRIRAFFIRLLPSVAALSGAALLGCGGGGGSSVCDIDFGSIAGTYTFTWTTHNARFNNSCFDNFEDPEATDPSKVTNCTWEETSDDETITVELQITEDGDVGNAKILSVSGDDVEPSDESIGLKCEMLGGAVCDAPVRCNITGDKCATAEPVGDPDEWQYPCNCAPGSPNEPMTPACQQCKTEYEKYRSEQTEFCQKSKDGDYFEFTLHVKE